MQDLRSVKIMWEPPAPEGYLTQFDVLFTTAETTAATLPNWPGRSGMGTRLIFRAELPNTQSVWVVSREQPVPESMRQMIEDSRRKVIAALKHHAGEAEYYDLPEPRADIYGHHPQRQWRYFIDFCATETPG
jgi:hypothetical protein